MKSLFWITLLAVTLIAYAFQKFSSSPPSPKAANVRSGVPERAVPSAAPSFGRGVAMPTTKPHLDSNTGPTASASVVPTPAPARKPVPSPSPSPWPKSADAITRANGFVPIPFRISPADGPYATNPPLSGRVNRATGVPR